MSNTNDDHLVVVEALTRHYGNLCAVDNVSFSLSKGEVLGFLGPNGAGKSTTMQMLCGALAPSAGRITINSIDLLEQPRQAKQAIGFLPEQPPLYFEFTVNEYLYYCAQLRNIGKAKRAAAIDTVKQRCGLTDVGKRLIGNLSKGFQQRIGIAQAIIHSPPVVILDEPTIGLDPIQIREIRELIKTLGKDHSVILSTHILPEVQISCSRVLIINRGKLVFSDSIAHLNQQQQASSLILQLQHPPPLAQLESIAGVNDIETLSTQRFRIHYHAEQSPASMIAQAAVGQQWGLQQLTPETRSLEQIFIELTINEAATPTTGEAA